MLHLDRFRTHAAGVLLMSGCASLAIAANCNVTSVLKTPINDLGAGTYLGQFQGGLYPGGLNLPPQQHATAGIARADAITPRNTQGALDANGKYVLLSIGMSNTTNEFSRFQQVASTSQLVNHSHLAIVDGAQGGQSAALWESPNAATYNFVRDNRLAPLGLTEAQVQAVWLKQANPNPNISLPNSDADAYRLVQQLGNICRAIKMRYPNVQVVFLSSRIYAGYASTSLNPEPYAYESAFAVKWLIEAQINQMNGGGIDPRAGDMNHNTIAPWIAWGPYLWADGLTPRSDGLTWECADMAADGTHPSEFGRQKVALHLIDFLLDSPFSMQWFRGRVGDATGDGSVGVPDLLALINAWGPCPSPCPVRCAADVAPISGDCNVNVSDLLAVINFWSP